MHAMTEVPERPAAMKAAREPAIARALDQLDKATAVLAEHIGRADDRAARLEERIAVIVGPVDPSPSELRHAGEVAERAETSPMAFSLEIKAAAVLDLAGEVAKLADRLDGLADRVEL